MEAEQERRRLSLFPSFVLSLLYASGSVCNEGGSLSLTEATSTQIQAAVTFLPFRGSEPASGGLFLGDSDIRWRNGSGEVDAQTTR
jgi:hypothetical protein